MTPCYFGSSGRRLFGIYHPPAGPSARELGVVLCYPAVQEYHDAHWTFRKLATQLTRGGAHVFRFDYQGTGDSAGESGEGSLSAWRGDIEAAAQELRDVTGVDSVALVGLRVGAALALQACAGGLEATELVLWEPVVRGAAWVQELEALEESRRALSRHPTPRERTSLLGHPFPEAWRRELESLDLRRETTTAPRARTLIVASGDRPEHQELAQHLGGLGARVQRLPLPAAGEGKELEGAALHAIVGALTRGNV